MADFRDRWRKMLRRCDDPLNPRYADYGGRGIRVCARWYVYENFIADMGVPPDLTMHLDRINNDGDYTPLNCRWVTRSQSALNRRPRTLPTHCSRGHLLGDNPYVRPDGQRQCRECRNMHKRVSYHKRKGKQ